MPEGSTSTIEQRLEAVEKALQGQGAVLKEVHEYAKKTRRYILWGRIMSLIYLILIVAPLIIAALYLPPLIDRYSGVYKDLLNVSGSMRGNEAVFENLERQLQMFQQGR